MLGWSVGPGPGGSAVDVATRERTAVSVSANERPGYELVTNERAGGLCGSVYLCDDLETESSQSGHYCHSVTRTPAQLSQTANQKYRLGEDQPSVTEPRDGV